MPLVMYRGKCGQYSLLKTSNVAKPEPARHNHLLFLCSEHEDRLSEGGFKFMSASKRLHSYVKPRYYQLPFLCHKGFTDIFHSNEQREVTVLELAKLFWEIISHAFCVVWV